MEESDESNIKDFLAIKDRLSNEQLVDFIDMVLPNIGDNHYIRVLILGVKDRLKRIEIDVKDRLKRIGMELKRKKIAPDLIEEIFKYTESSKIEIIKQYASILNISW